MSESISLDINAVMRLLPHRYPFLMVDRVIECRKGESIRAIKNVTANEPFFMGHFPDKPVMPGVLIIEALAQTAAGPGKAAARRRASSGSRARSVVTCACLHSAPSTARLPGQLLSLLCCPWRRCQVIMGQVNSC